jgi:alpha-beta hydrolase superfamily lysophospholipase
VNAARPEKSFHFSGVDGRLLFARTWAAGEPIAGQVGIVHGMGEHSGRYRDAAEFLCRGGYRVTAFDQRGHGKTEGRRGHVSNYELLLDDLESFVAQLQTDQPGSKLFLYGHSFGGNVVLNYALRRSPSLAGLVITSPLLRLSRSPPFWKRWCAQACARLAPSLRLRTGVDLEGLSRDPDVARQFREDPLTHGVISARLAIDALDAGEWILAHADELRIPLLLIHGSRDRITSPEASRELAEKLAEASCLFKLWPGMLHEPHSDPERWEVLELIVAWMQTRLLTP